MSKFTTMVASSRRCLDKATHLKMILDYCEGPVSSDDLRGVKFLADALLEDLEFAVKSAAKRE